MNLTAAATLGFVLVMAGPSPSAGGQSLEHMHGDMPGQRMVSAGGTQCQGDEVIRGEPVPSW